MIIVGIDPGATGGITRMTLGSENGPSLSVQTMPWMPKLGIDAGAVRTLVIDADHVFVEAVSIRPGEGGKSTRTTCTNWGRIVGIVEGLGRPLTIVTPQAWQKVMLAGQGRGDRKARKTASIVTAQRLWPWIDFRPTERCKVSSDGMTDSALIAEYGRRMLLGGNT